MVVLEIERPTASRRAAAFAQAVYDGEIEIEGIKARRFDTKSLMRPVGCRPTGVTRASSTDPAARLGWVPVVVDHEGRMVELLSPDVVVDARMAKRNLGTRCDDAPLTVGLGPGFTAGCDTDLVVETRPGNELGRVIETGSARLDTGVPGEVAGYDLEIVLRAPVSGRFEARRRIGELVGPGEIVGSVDGEPVTSRIRGLVRGLVADGVRLERGGKIGDIDPRGEQIDHATISDRARAIGGAVLEAVVAGGFLPGARAAA